MSELTFSSLVVGGHWGSRSMYKRHPVGVSPVDDTQELSPLNDDDFFVQTIQKNAYEQMMTRLHNVPNDRFRDADLAKAGVSKAGVSKGDVSKAGGRAIMRAYLDLVKAAKDLTEANYNGSELDLGLINPRWDVSTTTATYMCFFISAFVALAFIGIAVLMSIWGVGVHGKPTSNVTALMFYADEVPMATPVDSNMTCAVESQDKFEIGKFLGVPDTNVFWNLYAGLILGLIFGFLDNFGLFYGMGALDSFFYEFGTNIAAGVMYLFRHDRPTSDLVLQNLHTVTGDLMAGLGNTFSDLLGVSLGTAALEIAKAGLNVDPAFWVLDLVAIVLGCLLGCFMPVLVKHKELLGGKHNQGKMELFAWVNIFGLFIAVILAGVPYELFNILSVVIVVMNIVCLLLLLLVSYALGGGVMKDALASLNQPPGSSVMLSR